MKSLPPCENLPRGVIANSPTRTEGSIWKSVGTSGVMDIAATLTGRRDQVVLVLHCNVHDTMLLGASIFGMTSMDKGKLLHTSVSICDFVLLNLIYIYVRMYMYPHTHTHTHTHTHLRLHGQKGAAAQLSQYLYFRTTKSNTFGLVKQVLLYY